ncbi:DUF2795 domain-containing protein [Streptomyces sp. NPDC003015]
MTVCPSTALRRLIRDHHVFPADASGIAAALRDRHAPDALVETVEGLPEQTTVFEHPTTSPARCTAMTHDA